MTRARTRPALALVLALWAAGAAAAEEAAPRYRFKEGERIAFVAEATTTIDLSAPGRTSTSRMTQLIDITWQVGPVDADGKAAVTQTIERVRFKAAAPGETVEYDTADGKAPDDPKARRFADLLNAQVGARLGVTIDPQGQFADFKAPGKAAGAGDPSSEAGFRHLVGQLIPVLPKEAPARGQTWTVKREGRVGEAVMSGESTYTYVGREDRGGKRVDKVALTVSMKREPDAPGPVAVKVSDGKGAAYLDRAAGRLVESSLTRTMEFEAGEGDARLTRKVTETITLKLAGGAN
jgi:hypothetical protein